MILLSAGCAIPVVKREDFKPIRTGAMFVAPPRNLTHGGNQVRGTGNEFLVYVKEKMGELSPAVKIVTDENSKFSNESVSGKDGILDYAKSVGADYAMIIILGEMRDAAPMTFRSDFVSLEAGSIYRVTDGREIWTAVSYRVEGSNLGSYNRLLKELAEKLVKSAVQE